MEVAKMNIISIYRKFPTDNDCLSHLEQVRWDGTPACPYCKSTKTTPAPKEKRHHCNACNTSFSVTVGTIMHKTKMPLQKWFLAISLILNAKKGISSRQLARDLEVNRNTAWYLAMRVRKAMAQTEQRELLSGLVEMDETYVGGKPRKGSGGNNTRGRGTKKAIVIGIAERGGDLKASIHNKNKKLNAKSLSSLVRQNVDTRNSILITDEYRGYCGVSRFMRHEVVKHKVWYVDGFRHTNTVESFWALLKRGIVGQYHKVSLRHLNKYVDEFCYRYNHRKNDDVFDLTIKNAMRCANVQ
jgi:transposase-like protein